MTEAIAYDRRIEVGLTLLEAVKGSLNGDASNPGAAQLPGMCDYLSEVVAAVVQDALFMTIHFDLRQIEADNQLSLAKQLNRVRRDAGFLYLSVANDIDESGENPEGIEERGYETRSEVADDTAMHRWLDRYRQDNWSLLEYVEASVDVLTELGYVLELSDTDLQAVEYWIGPDPAGPLRDNLDCPECGAVLNPCEDLHADQRGPRYHCVAKPDHTIMPAIAVAALGS